MTDEITLRFEVPGKDAPGYLKRMKEALEFQEALQGDVGPATLDRLVIYLAQFVVEPDEQEAKLDALWMASQNEFMALLKALTGGDEAENPTE